MTTVQHDLGTLRSRYHQQVCGQILAERNGVLNIADRGNRSSIQVAEQIRCLLGWPIASSAPSGQRAGKLFENLTRDFLKEAFRLFSHLRPGQWRFSVNASIAEFDQYWHLGGLLELAQQHPDIAAVLNTSYLIKPDIVIGRQPVSDDDINRCGAVITPSEPVALFAPLRAANFPNPRSILHASVSCKWTIRSDRAQNMRSEALNLIRTRKGRTPHVVAVTAEPLPTRIASVALGTGDLDCVYHWALYELQQAVDLTDNVDQRDMLETLVKGRRLRDISDLPLDLAI